MNPTEHKPVSPSQNRREIPSWQLPAGVSRGAWDYAHLPSIATQYDAFHADHPLLALDQTLIGQVADEVRNKRTDIAKEPPVVIDLGCGTGRSIFPLAQSGWKAMGVDLSQHMLDEAARKADSLRLGDQISWLQSNIVELDRLENNSADLVLCMYSSIGMIQGTKNRQQLFDHVRRILRPQGRFVVHAHNRGTWLRIPHGLRMTVGGWWRARRDRNWELGDRIYPYRGLPNMFLHIFSQRELRRELKRSALHIKEMHLLNVSSSQMLTRRWLLPHLRAGGFIAVCSREDARVEQLH